MIERWYLGNIGLLAKIFGQVSYDDSCFTWIKVHGFDLPEIYFQKQTTLLILTPGYNLDNHQSFNFFVNQNMQRKDRIPPPFVHEIRYNHLRSYGYARLSFHLTSFKPSADIVSGDNLLELLKSIYHFN